MIIAVPQASCDPLFTTLHSSMETHHKHSSIRPGILTLPFHLRHRIYEISGICGPNEPELGCIYDLNGIRHRPEQIRPQFHGLLLSCRAIYYEASRLLYATHRFTIGFGARNSLASLRQLTPASLGVLSRLQIILAEASCHCPGAGDWIFDGDCCSDMNNVHCLNDVSGICKRDHCHDASLEGADAAMLEEWQETATCLADKITAGHLHLAVVCDVCPTNAGIQAATSVTSSLLRLPKLRHLSIRLCQQPEPRLNQLAHDIVLQTRHIITCPSKKSSFTASTSSRFLNLPAELRMRILSYTDLITPWTEVAWSPRHRGFLASHTYCDNLAFAGASCPPRLHHGCQFSRCYITYPEPSNGCFCRLQHSAFSSATACKCWASPQALFLVCRTLRADSQAVFYAGNRFVVHDDGQSTARDATVVASRFLRSVVTADALRYLRFLEFVFPPDAWPRADKISSVLQMWDKTLDWAEEEINTAALTIRIIVALDVDIDMTPAVAGEGRANAGGFIDSPEEGIPMAREQGIERIAGFMRVVRPLALLRGLHAFYAHPGGLWKDEIGGQRQAAIVERSLKERAERLIMGERYEAQYAGGCEEPERSLWPRQLWPLRDNDPE